MVALNAHVWEDPGCWGMLLSDITEHLANAYAKDGDPPTRDAAVKRILEVFNAERANPTDAPRRLR